MVKKNTNTALLIFVRCLNEESERKNLVSNPIANRQLFQFLNKNIESTAIKSGLPYFIIETQVGTTFGERLGAAIKEVFEKGYENVITIGNDCPELTESVLQASAEILRDSSSIIGADQHNGAYLIGLSKDRFDYDKFIQIRWQSKMTVEDLKSYFLKYQLLPQAADINDAIDLFKYLKLAPKTFRKAIYFISKTIAFTSNNHTGLILGQQTSAPPILRGPPRA